MRETSILGRMINNIEDIKCKYRAGISKRTLAKEYGVSQAHFLNKWFELESMGYITADDYDEHCKNAANTRREMMTQNNQNSQNLLIDFLKTADSRVYVELVLCNAITSRNTAASKYREIIGKMGYTKIKDVSDRKLVEAVDAVAIGFRCMKYEKLVAHIIDTEDTTKFRNRVGDYILSVDQINGIQYLLDNKLDEMERYVIVNRYLNSDYIKTLESVAEPLGLTKARIGQVYNKAMRKLANAVNFNYIKLGLVGNKIYMQNKRQAVEEASKRLGVSLVLNREFNQLYIKELNLSTRAYNALNRAGIKTVADIKSMEQINKINGIGDKTVNEIRTVLRSLGLVL